MASFTNISELSVAEVLSSSIGELTGSLSTKALETLENLIPQLETLCDNIGDEDKESILEVVEGIEKVVDTVEKTINTLSNTLSTLGTTAKSIEIPATALDISLKVIKALPTPPLPPVIITLSVLSETIAQIKQIVSALTSVASTLQSYLDMVTPYVDKIRKCIQAIRAALALKGVDNEALSKEGIDSTLVADVGKAILVDSTYVLGQGIQETSSSGDWVSVAYIQSESEPKTPTSRNFQPENWTLVEPVASSEDDWWSSSATVSGKSNMISGEWSKPERYTGKGGSQVYVPETFNTGSSENVIISSAEEGYNYLVDLVDKIGAAGISFEGQSDFRKTMGTQNNVGNKYYYTSSLGDIYELTIKTDNSSTKVAPRYYVEAVDIKTNVTMYTGTKTFASDSDVLISEARVRLDRIFA